jgi:hypothetical protein
MFGTARRWGPVRSVSLARLLERRLAIDRVEILLVGWELKAVPA